MHKLNKKHFLSIVVIAAVVTVALFALSQARGGCGFHCNDTDRDGIKNWNDNCPEIYNPMQLDRDGDGIGDVCDGYFIDEDYLVIPVEKVDEFIVCVPNGMTQVDPPGLFIADDDDDDDDDAPPPPLPPTVNCETIVVSGQVLFHPEQDEHCGRWGCWPTPRVLFDIFTEEEAPLMGYSELFGNVELYLDGYGSYKEKFDGLDFPADMEIRFNQGFRLEVDTAKYCETIEGQVPAEHCGEIEDERVSITLNSEKYESGIIKAFPPLYENPICTELPPFDFTPIGLNGPYGPEMYLKFNCDEFGTPVINRNATPQPRTYTDINTEAEVNIDLRYAFRDDKYKFTGLSTIAYEPDVFDGGPFGGLETVNSELVELDLVGLSPALSAFNGEDTKVHMKLLTEDPRDGSPLSELNSPFTDGINQGIEFKLWDIVHMLYGGMFDFEILQYPMVGGMHAYVALETDLNNDGDKNVILPMIEDEIIPVVLGSYPGKKGFPPYYTPYCTIENSYVLQLLDELGFNYIPDRIPLYNVMTNDEVLPHPFRVGYLDLMCLELREDEICNEIDNDLDGLVDEGPYNYITEEGTDYVLEHTYDFDEDWFHHNNNSAYHSAQPSNPPTNDPWSLDDTEFGDNKFACWGNHGDKNNEYYCQIDESDGSNSGNPYNSKRWAHTDDSYEDDYNTQRFVFGIPHELNDDQVFRAHWEGRALESGDTATLYVWNYDTDEWEYLGDHASYDDQVIEATFNLDDHIDNDEVILLVQGDVTGDEEENGYKELMTTVLGDDDDDDDTLYSEQLFTDYVKLEVLTEVEGCEEQGGGSHYTPKTPTPASTPDPLPQEDAPEPDPKCLYYNLDREIAYKDSKVAWIHPYVEFLSKLYFMNDEVPFYILNGYDVFVSDFEKTGELVKPARKTARFEALLIAMKSYCIPPYTLEELRANKGESVDFADYPRIALEDHPALGKYDLNTVNYISRHLYKAKDLGLIQGRSVTDKSLMIDPTKAKEWHAAWDAPITRGELFKIFVNASAANLEMTEEEQEMFKDYYLDVPASHWAYEFVPFAAKHGIAAVEVVDPNVDAVTANRRSYVDRTAVRGEVFAMATRMLYITTALDYTHPYSGFPAQDKELNAMIFEMFTGTERSEFLLQVMDFLSKADPEVVAMFGYLL